VSGDGVTLEPQVAAHAAELHPLLSDLELYLYMDDKGPASEAALRERFTKLETRLSGDGAEHWLNWVVRNTDGVAVGFVQATVYPNRSAEIAYVIGRPFWRRGYGRVACEAMIDHLVASYGATQLFATLDPQNAASLALLKSLGFGFLSDDPSANEVTYSRGVISPHNVR
jgi:[ribosomal protein S5]-alanine N-acetyltransferase